jgi:ATP-dependent DNA helicase RecG
MPTTETPWQQPIDSVSGIGPKRAVQLSGMGIDSLADLLFHIPRRYHDRSSIVPIASVEKGESVTVEGVIVSARMIRLRGRQTIAELTIKDETGTIKATWFGRGYLVRSFVEGFGVILSGVVKEFKGLALQNPEYELLGDDSEGDEMPPGLLPIYPLSEGVSQRLLRKWIKSALELLPTTVASGLQPEIPSGLPVEIEQAHGLMPLREAVQHIHYPTHLDEARDARKRLAYEELFYLQVRTIQAANQQKELADGLAHRVNGDRQRKLSESLPFELSSHQQRAIGEIMDDMKTPSPMGRLLQGDVGCGKTVVALHAIAAAVDSGYQAVFMAPTEVLAEQHFYNLNELLRPLDISCGLLTGNSADSKRVRAELADGSLDVVAGTHALFQDNTLFDALGLVVIDEQHRFGVMQREQLVSKGHNPDMLQMSATPIPRTLTQTVYGSMELSIIDELPAGRTPIKTSYIPESKLPGMYRFILDEVGAGRQAYIVCPLVEESENLELQDVLNHYEEISAETLGSVRCGLLHGRMSGVEKEETIYLFKQKELDVLFSTTVIEVGVDVADASVMVIVDAGQFGLTQLHQLRGRVGRSHHKSYCFLTGKPKTPEGKQRIEIISKTENGFDIAEKDLEMRGPGEFKGVKQSGYSDMRIANLISDSRLIDIAKKDAQQWALSKQLEKIADHSPFQQSDGNPEETSQRSI